MNEEDKNAKCRCRFSSLYRLPLSDPFRLANDVGIINHLVFITKFMVEFSLEPLTLCNMELMVHLVNEYKHIDCDALIKPSCIMFDSK